jgi:hypothetical protein
MLKENQSNQTHKIILTILLNIFKDVHSCIQIRADNHESKKLAIIENAQVINHITKYFHIYHCLLAKFQDQFLNAL